MDLTDVRNWWSYTPGACWSRPEGPESDTYTRGGHPVTQVAYEDAEAYAAWAGKALPTKAEWEYAVRGGLEGKAFAWGTARPRRADAGQQLAGRVPVAKPDVRRLRGHLAGRRLPGERLRPLDMTGNVWEWTTDLYTASHAAEKPCCAPARSDEPIPRRIIKGGSHLCAPNYCLRFRPAARQGEAVDTSTGHIGFRCIFRTA